MDTRAQNGSAIWSPNTGSLSFEELTAQQGIAPVEDFEALLGSPPHDDESGEEFSTMLREWRREGAARVDGE